MYKEFVKRISKQQPNEFSCHISFVVKLSSVLAKKYCPESVETVKIAALLHDVGRGREIEGESHAQAGSRLARIWLHRKLEQAQIDIITRCIEFHNSPRPNATVEENVVTTADALSKVVFHEAFMLLCKKTTPEERAIWGQKYLRKGYALILFPHELRDTAEKYIELDNLYSEVLSSYVRN